MNILVTGSCGFIGYHLCKMLLNKNHIVIGIDNMNSYYNVKMKEDRLTELSSFNNFTFYKYDLCEYENIKSVFRYNRIDIVINLAAQAGVRYSIENPRAYINSNIVGFFNILECCKLYNIKKLIYASSSSVYGKNEKIPFEEDDKTDNPVSLYAATKKSNEELAECYSTLYNIQCVGLRFFTVYGPSGRPDMAPALFANAIENGRPINVFNNGNMLRDFTYIDDIVNGIIKIVDIQRDEKHEIYNIGCGNPVNLMKFINEIEKNLGKTANIVYKPMQKGDVVKTFADCNKLKEHYDYIPFIKIEEGVKNFINWYKNNKEYYENCR